MIAANHDPLPMASKKEVRTAKTGDGLYKI